MHSWPDRPCVDRLNQCTSLSATDYHQSSDAQVTMVTSFNKSVQPRSCEATRSLPTELGNTLVRAAAHVSGHPHSLQTSAKSCLRAACLLHPTRAFSSRAETLGRPDWVAGPTSCRRARPLGPRLVAVEAALAVLPEGSLKGPGEARGRGSGARADSEDEAHTHPLRTAAAPASPARPRALSPGGQGEIHLEGEKNHAGTRSRPGREPTEAATPLRPRVSLTYSPPLRLHRRRRDRNRSPLRAPPRASHAPATPPGPPRPSPALSRRCPRFSRAPWCGYLRTPFFLLSLVTVTVVELSCELRQAKCTSLVHPPWTVYTPLSTEKERAIGMAVTKNAIFHVGGTRPCLTRRCSLVGLRKFRRRALSLLCQP